MKLTLSQNIRALRKARSLTQEQFAEVMGVSIKTMEAWEAGTNRPVGSARRFLSVLAADPELLSDLPHAH